MCVRVCKGRWQVIAWTVCFIIWYLLFAVSFCDHLPDYPPESPRIVVLSVYLLVWHVLWTMTLWSLYEAVFTPPPAVPSAYQLAPDHRPIAVEGNSESYFETLAAIADARGLRIHRHSVKAPTGVCVDLPAYCAYCCAFKPDRSHHCDQCDRCVARMDHHCPVIGTCVHYGNHKQFLLFLFWAWLVCLYTCAVCCPYIVLIVRDISEDFPTDQVAPLVLTAVGCATAFACLLSLGFLLSSLMIMLLSNDTTLERIGRRSYSARDAYGHSQVVSYDLGSWCANFKSIFGDQPHLWLLPVHSALGNGLTFKSIVSQGPISDFP